MDVYPTERVRAHQWAWWLNFSKACDERLRDADHSTFMGVERWMDDEMCAGVLYGVILRDPLARVLSNTHYAWTYGWRARPPDVLQLAADGAVGCSGANRPMSWQNCVQVKCATVERSVAAYDNLYVRSLNGRHAFALAAGTLTREHLEVAMARLRGFAVVMQLEQFDEQSAQLRAYLGWKHVRLPHLVNAGGRHGNTRAKYNFSELQLNALRDANSLDFELYAFATALSRNRTEMAWQIIRDESQRHQKRYRNATSKVD